jgi:hypothetical protein
MANANRKNQNHQPVTKKGRLNEMDTPFLHTTLDITCSDDFILSA